MIVSRCCKSRVFVESSNEGTAFYVCTNCYTACDTIDSSPRTERKDDTRNAFKAKAFPCFT